MLPVLSLAGDITATLVQRNRLVLTAPTGSGNCTQAPQILFKAQEEANLPKGDLIVLQPRRLATRMVARRVAQEMKVDVGSVVGYQTRHESKVSRDTRIRFMTEG